MSRNVRGASRPTLADILMGKHISNAADERSNSVDSHRSYLSDLNSMRLSYSDVMNTGINQCRRDGKSSNSSLEVGRPNRLRLSILQKRQLREMFDEENGVTCDNIMRLLERLGIDPLSSRTLLESCFKTSNGSQSSLSMAQWISLVEDLFNLPENTGGNRDEGNNSLKHKNNTRVKRNQTNSYSGSVSKSLLTQTLPGDSYQDETKTNTDSSVYGTVRTNYMRGKGREIWITGSEEMDAALIKLFIHCGALDRRGRGIELFLEDFRRMSDLRQNTLPPRRIVWEAASLLSYWCVADSSSNNTPTGNLYMTLSQFLALLQGEVQAITKGLREGGAKSTSVPIVAVVLAALSPEPMKRLCGTEIVEYLRSPVTIKYVLRELEQPGGGASHFAYPTSLQESGVATKQFLVPTTSSLPPRANPSHRSHSSLFSCEIANLNPTYVEGLGSNTGAIERKGYTRSSSGGSRSSFTMRSDRQRYEIPRYMEPKPLDEISASIIARSKARRVIDELRKNTIPINRYECFARIEFVRQSLLEEGNLDNYDLDDDNHDCNASEAYAVSPDRGALRNRNLVLQRKVNLQDISGSMLPGLHRMGGVEPPQPCRARQETFERLYRSRFGYTSSSDGLLMQRSPSATNSIPSRSRSATDLTTRAPAESRLTRRKTSTPILSEAAPVDSTSESPLPAQCQHHVSTKNVRQDPRPPLMLADIFSTPFLGVLKGSDRSSHNPTDCRKSSGE